MVREPQPAVDNATVPDNMTVPLVVLLDENMALFVVLLVDSKLVVENNNRRAS